MFDIALISIPSTNVRNSWSRLLLYRIYYSKELCPGTGFSAKMCFSLYWNLIEMGILSDNDYYFGIVFAFVFLKINNFQKTFFPRLINGYSLSLEGVFSGNFNLHWVFFLSKREIYSIQVETLSCDWLEFEEDSILSMLLSREKCRYFSKLSY